MIPVEDFLAKHAETPQFADKQTGEIVQISNTVPTVKLRDFQKNSSKYLGSDFQLVDGNGEVVGYVYKVAQSSNQSFTEEDRANLLSVHKIVEDTNKLISQHSL